MSNNIAQQLLDSHNLGYTIFALPLNCACPNICLKITRVSKSDSSKGLVCSLSGSTYVHLELLFQCDTSSVSFALTLQALGCVIGGFLSMFTSRLSVTELEMGVALVLIAITTIGSTLYTSVYWFLAMTVIQGCGLGIYNSGTI